MAPRFFMAVSIFRPTVGADSDLTVGAAAATGVRCSIWDMREREILGAVGEVVTVNARGYFKNTTSLVERDRLESSDGRKWEVMKVVSGLDDRGRLDHIGAWLRNVD